MWTTTRRNHKTGILKARIASLCLWLLMTMASTRTVWAGDCWGSTSLALHACDVFQNATSCQQTSPACHWILIRNNNDSNNNNTDQDNSQHQCVRNTCDHFTPLGSTVCLKYACHWRSPADSSSKNSSNKDDDDNFLNSFGYFRFFLLCFYAFVNAGNIYVRQQEELQRQQQQQQEQSVLVGTEPEDNDDDAAVAIVSSADLEMGLDKNGNPPISVIMVSEGFYHDPYNGGTMTKIAIAEALFPDGSKKCHVMRNYS